MAENSRPSAFVTGASYGVGAATALALARAGYDVAISATRAQCWRTSGAASGLSAWLTASATVAHKSLREGKSMRRNSA